MNINEIRQAIEAGELYLVGSHLLTAEQHKQYTAAIQQAEYYDMLQGVRKVLL
jgi:glycerol-3-phosphate cytidylyltransferase-like family protein